MLFYGQFVPKQFPFQVEPQGGPDNICRTTLCPVDYKTVNKHITPCPSTCSYPSYTIWVLCQYKQPNKHSTIVLSLPRLKQIVNVLVHLLMVVADTTVHDTRRIDDAHRIRIKPPYKLSNKPPISFVPSIIGSVFTLCSALCVWWAHRHTAPSQSSYTLVVVCAEGLIQNNYRVVGDE